MVELDVRHITSTRPRRDEERRGPKSKTAILVSGELIGQGNGGEGRRHVVEKAAPFIEIDDQQCARPVRTNGHGVVDLIQERFAVADVRVGVIVIRGAAGFILETRVNEAYLR